MKAKVINYVKAGYPSVAIRTVEEARALPVLFSVADELKINCFTWNATMGLKQVKEANEVRVDCDETKSPDEMLTKLLAAMKDGGERIGMIAICDLHTWVKHLDPVTERALKDVLKEASNTGTFVVFLGVGFEVPESFQSYVSIMDFSLPTKEELDTILKKIEDSCREEGINLRGTKNGDRADALRAARGLTAPEAENAFSLAIIEGGKGSAKSPRLDAAVVYREKVNAVRRTGLMDIIEPEPMGLEAIGGLNALKVWILEKKCAYTPEAEAYGLPMPKGMLACGVPGTGKTLLAKCIGTVLGAPTLRLDIGAIMSSLVGESEARMRAALALADAIAPCVLFVDEIEKGLAGSMSSGNLDSGVGRRILGTLLTWANDHKSEVFLCATANQVQFLPPELLRKGRFDEIFTVDLPVNEEREEIFRIHLARRNRDPKNFDMSALIGASKDFSGAEIEQMVIAGMFRAFADGGREVTTKDIASACKDTVPLAKTMAEEVKAIREWGENRARPASSAEADTGTKFRRLMGDN